MSPPERIAVASGILEWARISAGFAQDGAAKRLNVSVERLAEWEAGASPPTVKQLRSMAKLYRRPLAVLLLPAPPKDFDALRDFRRLDAGKEAEWSPRLHIEFKRALTQRDVFLELAELAPGSLPEGGVAPSFGAGLDSEEAGDILRAALQVASSRFPDPGAALNTWLEAAEGAGILVIQTARVAIEEMRGFSISDRPFPVIALNGGDWPRARLFTLVHELCHLALSAGGLCDLHERRGQRVHIDDVEHYCNLVAASTLMPRDEVFANGLVRRVNASYAWTLQELAEVSRPFGVSSEALLLRLITLEKATWDTYWQRRPELQTEYEEARRRRSERQRESDGGPSYYVVKARDLGHGYVSSVLDAYRSRAISSLDVADYLDVRFDQLPKLEAVLR